MTSRRDKLMDEIVKNAEKDGMFEEFVRIVTEIGKFETEEDAIEVARLFVKVYAMGFVDASLSWWPSL